MIRVRKKLSKEDLARLYLDEKKSLGDIAKMYGVSRQSIWKYCKSTEIETRSKSEARLEALKQKKLPQEYAQINENFFSSWSDKMAYVLGLIITDGCISSAPKGITSSVHLDMNDRSLLKKVKKAMGSEHKITLSKHQKGLYLFSFARERIIKDLLRLGITPRKSLSVKFPDVPDEYLRHFLRGVFDGDGSVFFEPRNPKFPLRAKFDSGSKDFIYKLEEKLQKFGMPKRTIYEEKRKRTSYMFRYSHQDSVRLFHLLYDGVDKSLYLERKHNRFIEGLKYPTRIRNYNTKMPKQKELREFKELHNFYRSHYTVSGLSKRLGISRDTIYRWLNCEAEPNEDRLRQLRKYLDEKAIAQNQK